LRPRIPEDYDSVSGAGYQAYFHSQDTAEIWNIHISDQVVSPSTRRTVGRGHGKNVGPQMNPILRCTILARALLGVDLAQAQNAPAAYPQHPVRMIVPFPPGGPADICGRLLAQKLSQSLGQQVYV
jgi:hypothetical protein